MLLALGEDTLSKMVLDRNIDGAVTILRGGSAAAGETSLHIFVLPHSADPV